MTDYAYFIDVRASMGTDLSEDAFKHRVRDLIREASVFVELRTDRRFDHRYEIRPYNARRIDRGGNIADDNITLMLDDDLQSITELINNHSDVVDVDRYVALPSNKSVAHPYHDMIQMTTNDVYWAYTGGQQAERSISVTGTWGWGGTWKRHSTLSSDVDDEVAILTLSSYLKLDYGKILRIDDEFIEIDDESLPATAPTSITGVRGVNGSIPAAHTADTPVYVFIPHPVVARLVKNIVAWQSALEDSPVFGSVTIGDSSQPVDLTTAPKTVRDALELLSRKN